MIFFVARSPATVLVSAILTYLSDANYAPRFVFKARPARCSFEKKKTKGEQEGDKEKERECIPGINFPSITRETSVISAVMKTNLRKNRNTWLPVSLTGWVTGD